MNVFLAARCDVAVRVRRVPSSNRTLYRILKPAMAPSVPAQGPPNYAAELRFFRILSAILSSSARRSRVT